MLTHAFSLSHQNYPELLTNRPTPYGRRLYHFQLHPQAQKIFQKVWVYQIARWMKEKCRCLSTWKGQSQRMAWILWRWLLRASGSQSYTLRACQAFWKPVSSKAGSARWHRIPAGSSLQQYTKQAHPQGQRLVSGLGQGRNPVSLKREARAEKAVSPGIQPSGWDWEKTVSG